MTNTRNPASDANAENKKGNHADELADVRFDIDPRVGDVIAFLKANLHRMIAAKELEDLVALSYSYLSSLFKADTGVSPMEYLRRLKMEKAAELLRNTRLSIKEIMGRLGYKTHKSFLRHFKRSFRVPPTIYRRRFLAERVRRLRGSEES